MPARNCGCSQVREGRGWHRCRGVRKSRGMSRRFCAGRKPCRRRRSIRSQAVWSFEIFFPFVILFSVKNAYLVAPSSLFGVKSTYIRLGGSTSSRIDTVTFWLLADGLNNVVPLIPEAHIARLSLPIQAVVLNRCSTLVKAVG